MEYKDEEKILIVSTVNEIKIFKYVKNPRDLKISLIDTGFSLATDSNIIGKIA